MDNTFPTPVNCQPIRWGADIVTHSTTKYMDGHGAALGGVIVDSGNFDWMAHAEKYPGLCTPDESYHGITYAEKFGNAGAYITKCTSQLMRDLGCVQSPQNAFILNLGLESSRAVPRKTTAGGVRQLSAPAVQPILRPRHEVHAERRLRGGVVRLEGRTSRGGGIHETADFGGD